MAPSQLPTTIANSTIDNNQAKGGDGGIGGRGGQGQRFSLGWPVYFIGGLGGDGGVGGDGAIGRGGGIFNAGLATLTNIVVGKHSIFAGSSGLAGPGGPGGENFSGPLAPSGKSGTAGRNGFAFGEFIYNSGGILSNQPLNGIFDEGGFVEIANNWAVYLTVSNLSVTEDGNTKLVYTFSRRGGLSNPLTVNYSVGGTAKLNTDYTQTGASTYTATAGTATFTPGSSTATVTIDPTSDTIIESNRTVVLTLEPGEGYAIGGSSVQAGEITDDDSTVRLSVSPSDVKEDDIPNLIYTFTRSGNTSDALTVNYTVGGTATYGTDYSQIGGTSFSASSGTVTFAANADTAILSINPTSDTAIEPDETIVLSLTSGSYKIGTTEALSRTMINDDASVSLTVSPGSVQEDGAQNLIYTFTRTGATANPLTVNYTVNGTATLNTDYTQSGANTYTATTGTITFAAESTTANITIAPTADTVPEPKESIGLTLASGTGYTISDPVTITGSITDNDSTVTLAVSPGSATEDGTSNLIFTFTRSGDTTDELTVNYTVGGTAVFDIDYNKTESDSHSATAGTATFAPGSATATVTINPTADTSIEPDETVALTLAAGSYKIGTTATVTGTIVNDDTTISLSVSPSTVAEEGPSQLVYTFTRAEATSIPLTVYYTVGGSALFDTDYDQTGAATYTQTTGSVTFAVGSNTATVAINPTADDSVEPNETVTLSLTPGTGYVIGTTAPVVGTFTSLPDQLIRTPTATSHPGNTHQEVRNGSAFAALKNDGSVITWGDPANGGNSSLVASQLIGAVSQIISNYWAFAALKGDGSVVSWGDSRYGGNSSSVASQLSSGVTRMASTASAFAALKSNGSVVTWGNALAGGYSSDVASQLASGVTQIFSNGYAFAALKTNGSVVTWGSTSFGGNSSGVASQLASGVTRIVSTRGAFAALKSDGSLVIWGNAAHGGNNAGVASQLTSGVRDVFTSEASFAALKNDGSVVTWGPASSGGDSSPVATQLRSGVMSFADPFHDDRLVVPAGEPRITLAVSPTTGVMENGTANLIYTFSRTGPTTSALTVNYTVAGTASLGSDYTGIAATPSNKSITFAAGLRTATVSVNPKDDNTIEPNETVALTLTAGSGYTIGTTAAVVGTIKNDDSSITLSLAPTTGVTEDGTTNLTYTFTRKGPTTSALTVNYTVGGTANLGTDYTGIAASPATKTITFAAGSPTASITVDPKSDTTKEDNETVRLQLTAGTGYTIATTAAVTGTIRNDDIIGSNGANTLVGTSINEYLFGAGGNDTLQGNGGQDRLDGGSGFDILTGGPDADSFVFRFSQSRLANPDRLTDFTIGTDKIDLLSVSSGTDLPAPSAFSRANNSTATTLATLVAAVFSDANGAIAGNQALATNNAALVVASARAIAGTYLVINDAVAGFQTSNDIVVNLTGHRDTLPRPGSIPVSSFFA